MMLTSELSAQLTVDTQNLAHLGADRELEFLDAINLINIPWVYGRTLVVNMAIFVQAMGELFHITD